MTAGFAAQPAGHDTEAIRYNRAALAADATAYPAANDLAVLLVRRGDASLDIPLIGSLAAGLTGIAPAAVLALGLI